MSGWSGGASALGSRTGVRRVLAAYAAFSLLEFYAWLVVVLWAYAVGGASLAGAAALVQLLPAAVLAPALAARADRLGRGTALVVAYSTVVLGAGLTWGVLVADSPSWTVLLCATALTTSIAVARPVHFAALPELARAEPEQLVSATAISGVIDGVARFAGPALAGLAVAVAGTAAAMAVGVVVSVAAPLLCSRLRLTPASPHEEALGTSAVGEAVEGYRALRRSPGAMALLLVMSADFLLTGVVDILGVAFADSVLDDGDAAAGLVVGAMGIGALVGALAGAGLAQRRWLALPVVGGALVEGVAFAGTAATDLLVSVVLVLALAGLGGSVTLVTGRTLLHRTTDERVLARVFAVQESVALLGLAAGAVLAPLLIRAVGVRAAWLPLGVAVAVLALTGLPGVRRLDARSRFLPIELALLRRVPFLAALAPYRLEVLADSVEWRDAAPGDAVVEQGSFGDDLYLVGEGELTAWVAGERRPGVLGPGRYFGEIAMLRGAPRTATVIAETPSRLLVVRRAAFLDAAGGDIDGTELALEAARAYPDLS